MWKAGFALLLLLGTAPLPADPPPARDEVQELNARYTALHGAKRYEEALGALEALGARPELSGDRDAQASIAAAIALTPLTFAIVFGRPGSEMDVESGVRARTTTAGSGSPALDANWR